MAAATANEGSSGNGGVRRRESVERERKKREMGEKERAHV